MIWQPNGDVPWYVTNVLEELKALKVNTIVVSNHDITASQLATLKGLAAKVLVRGNRGLDFGADRDAILQLVNQGTPISRLILMNDSVFVFKRGLRELLEQLLSDEYQVVAAYENWHIQYHFQSFCLALSGDVVADPRFAQFWKSYLPVSNRRWCIDHGEVKHSDTLRKIAKRFHIVYRANDMLEALKSEPETDDLLLYREFVPQPIRMDFPKDTFLEDLESADPAQRKLILQRAKESITRLLLMGSQAHTGVFFFPKFLASPFLKRDLVYREQFSFYELERMLNELGVVDELPMIADDIRRRGTGAHLKGFRRRRYRLGLI